MTLSPSAHLDSFCRDNLPPENLWPNFDFTLPELRYPDRLNCASPLLDDQVAALGGGRPALLSSSESWTYGELLHRANQIAQILTEDFGLVPGNRVLLRGPNNPWMVACWFGVVKAGGVAVTTMPQLRSGELSKIIDLTTPSLALCDHRFAADLIETDQIAALLYGGTEPTDLIARTSAKSGEFTNVATAADDVVLLATTSGTTGTPKATMHFHRDILAVADTFSARVLRPNQSDVFTGTPPLAFTFGLCGLVVFPLRVGAATLLLEKATPRELADAVREHAVSVLFTAPTAYRAILRENKAQSLASVRRCVSAGEHLPEAVWEEFYEETGTRIINGIGATEMLHVFIAASDDDIRSGATGKAVPGYTAAVLDDDGHPVPDGTPGRLAVTGPTGCRYLADDRQRQYVQNGWNITGDTYIRDSDGYFWYQSRSDDMIVSSGYNIAGPEVEEALGRHPDVKECAVVGLPDPDRGMIVHAAVVLISDAVGSDTKVRELQDFVKNELAPYKYPRSIEFLAELPRTPNGKIQRYRLRESRQALR
ncbi:AMP-binding protein [Rhodococcus opacus]|uniref:AMP-binding protein n=1 Tax=Rhodococcus opacus TaxID=37919 RepID=I7DM55_RHOOP|nr:MULTISPECIES: AMP-binding protein [Rhodococcus]ELB89923.1 AMP-dependent acetyl-coenzyme A synthetase and ligase [Rhodococcus wratislaviensis IFP 2016]NHU44113.1 AMP-binding protein [Rhodococcus sp. A14]AFO70157.1 putative phenylacetyl CoA-ligase [Rhodococcus opacus]MBA8963006.1 2-aminobenzoate-CoA ligase [Rhodococcus opacus]MBP2206496.1 2-aminobenzoate-CoA ligase [Rhodococcus opacus]